MENLKKSRDPLPLIYKKLKEYFPDYLDVFLSEVTLGAVFHLKTVEQALPYFYNPPLLKFHETLRPFFKSKDCDRAFRHIIEKEILPRAEKFFDVVEDYSDITHFDEIPFYTEFKKTLAHIEGDKERVFLIFQRINLRLTASFNFLFKKKKELEAITNRQDLIYAIFYILSLRDHLTLFSQLILEHRLEKMVSMTVKEFQLIAIQTAKNILGDAFPQAREEDVFDSLGLLFYIHFKDSLAEVPKKVRDLLTESFK